MIGVNIMNKDTKQELSGFNSTVALGSWFSNHCFGSNRCLYGRE